MGRPRWPLFGLILTIAFPLFTYGQATDTASRDLRINVLIHNYARVPPDTLTRAEREATAIFHKMGVDVLWIDCSPALANLPTDSACGQSSSTTVTVDIHFRFKASGGMMLADNDMGFALISADRAAVAYSYIERVAGSSADRPQILGHVMAHEIGHLLLGSVQHFDTGIMQGVWWLQDLAAAGRGDLVFTPPQAGRIRANLTGRNSRQKAGGEETIRKSKQSKARHCCCDEIVIFPCSERVISDQNASNASVCNWLRNQLK